MSSEQRYDYSYEQFVEGSLPSFDLFGESTGASTANFSPHELQEEYSANFQQVGQSFNDTYTPDQNQRFQTLSNNAGHSQFDSFAASQPSASSTDGFALLDLSTTVIGAGHLVFGAGDVRDQGDEFQMFANTAGHSQIDFSGFEASQPSTWGTDGVSSTNLATPDNEVVQKAPFDVPPLGPTDVSFFF
jgi:hypothetical protein